MSVKWYGAIGNGSTNDTAAIQAALDASSNIHFPDGTYIVTALTVPSNRVLHGNGASSVIKFLSSEDDTNMLANSDQSSGNSNIFIHNLKFDGDKSNHSVSAGFGRIIYFKLCDHVVIRDCLFNNSIRYTIWFDQTDQSLITGNAFDSCYYATFLDDCEKVRIVANEVSNGEDRGIYLIEAKKCVIANNTVTLTTSSGAYVGIELFNSTGTSQDNVISGNFLNKGRISVAKSSHCSITGNTIILADTYGIELTTTSDYSSITGNVIRNSGQDGILMQGSSKVSIANNTIDTPASTYDGILVYASAGAGLATTNSVSVVGNTIYNCSGAAGYGIRLFDNSGTEVNDCVVANNTIDTCVAIAIICSNANNNLITGNVLRNITATTEIDLTSGTSSGNRAYGNFTEESTSVASAGTVTLPEGEDYIVITGTTNITSVTASWKGRIVTLNFAAILTFTDGSNLTLAGNLVTTADDTITLRCDATDWIEMSRSVN